MRYRLDQSEDKKKEKPTLDLQKNVECFYRQVNSIEWLKKKRIDGTPPDQVYVELEDGNHVTIDSIRRQENVVFYWTERGNSFTFNISFFQPHLGFEKEMNAALKALEGKGFLSHKGSNYYLNKPKGGHPDMLKGHLNGLGSTIVGQGDLRQV